MRLLFQRNGLTSSIDRKCCSDFAYLSSVRTTIPSWRGTLHLVVMAPFERTVNWPGGAALLLSGLAAERTESPYQLSNDFAFVSKLSQLCRIENKSHWWRLTNMRSFETSLQSWEESGKKDHKRLYDTARLTTSHPTFRLNKPLTLRRLSGVFGKTHRMNTQSLRRGGRSFDSETVHHLRAEEPRCSSALGRRFRRMKGGADDFKS
jgi:hypothetical protein